VTSGSLEINEKKIHMECNQQFEAPWQVLYIIEASPIGNKLQDFVIEQHPQ